MDNLVSIIVPTYKRNIDVLKNCIHSLTIQSYNNIEIIIIDDNADEDLSIYRLQTKEVVDIFNDCRIKVYYNEINLGSAKTRDIGIKYSLGNYITFLDDDDIYYPNKVFNQLNIMKLKKADFSICDFELYYENNIKQGARIRNFLTNASREELFKLHLLYHMTCTDTFMFRKEYIEKIGGFSCDDVGDEFYLMMRAIENDGVFCYVPNVLVRAYIHKTGGISSGDNWISGMNKLFEFKKMYFKMLNKREIKYIKVRYYIVIAFYYYKKGKIFQLLNNSIKAFVYSPILFIKVIKLNKR